MQLYGLCMKKGSTIHDHLRQIDELSDQLTALEETVSELNKVAILLKQESYPTLVTALLARGDDELTDSTRNYKVWDPAGQMSYTRHDVIFNESDFIEKSAAVNRNPIEESINE